MDEDCLYLNIYLPSTLYTEVATREGHYYTLVDSIVSKSYPVMVFLYGGAFIAGGNGVPLYDGQFLAEKGNVIIVSVNYRFEINYCFVYLIFYEVCKRLLKEKMQKVPEKT